MALALYRTYRPGTFAEVVGQPHITGPLTRALQTGRIHHAYLFSGPRGCGKTSSARILARSLNCESGPTPTPCGTCRSCVELAPNGPGSIDVIELDAATHGLVDAARELRDKAIYAPAISRYKIYIVDEAHQLSDAAANALLKLVEEPPAHLRFVFATTEPDKIIPTIRSRTFHYGFRLVPTSELTDHLASICAEEGVAADRAALALIARAGGGSVRDALSVLGQLIAGAPETGLTHEDVIVALGVTDSRLLDDFVSALAQGQPAGMFSVVEAVVSAGHDPRRFLTDVLDRLRDLLLLKVQPKAVSMGLVTAPTELAQALSAQCDLLSLAELSRAADQVSIGLTQVKGATAPRLQLELLCARLALPASDSSEAGVLARLAQLERLVASGGAPATAAASVVGQPAALSQRHVPAQDVTAPPFNDQLTTNEQAGSPPAGSPPAEPAVATATQVGRGGQAQAPAREGASQPSAAGRAPRRPRVGPDPQADGPDRSGASPAQAASPDAEAVERPTGQPSPPVASPQLAGAQPDGKQDRGGLEQVRAAWPDVLAHLREQSRVAWMGFEGATPVSLSNGVLAVGLADGGRLAFLTRSGHDERLRQSILRIVGLDVTIDVVRSGTAPSTARDGAGVPARAGETQGGSGPIARPSRAERSSGARATPGDAAAGDPGTGLGPDLPAQAWGEGPAGWDDPSADDPDSGSGASGVDLMVRELGAQIVSEDQ